MELVYVKRFIKSEADLPKVSEMKYMVFQKYWGMRNIWLTDEPKVRTSWINTVNWYLEPVEMPTKDDANDFAAKIDISGSEYRGFLKCYNWLLSRLK